MASAWLNDTSHRLGLLCGDVHLRLVAAHALGAGDQLTLEAHHHERSRLAAAGQLRPWALEVYDFHIPGMPAPTTAKNASSRARTPRGFLVMACFIGALGPRETLFLLFPFVFE